MRSSFAGTTTESPAAKQNVAAVAPAVASSSTREETVWYLAYGSNLNSKVFEVRRGIKPIERAACVCPGYQLNFHIAGIPYFEPAFASVEEVPGGATAAGVPELHGVVYKITQSDYERVRRTEGGGGHEDLGYGERVVKVNTYDGRVLDALTLVATAGATRVGAQPSLRYKKLLVEGAEQHALKQHYRDYLASLPAYEAHGFAQNVARVALVTIALPPLLPFATVLIACRVFKIRSPRWVHVSVQAIARAIWNVHDYVLAPAFGRGDRSAPQAKSE